MESALIRTGHGYETGSRGRCEAFDGFTIIANPLGGFSAEDRARRVWQKGGYDVTFDSHSIALAEREGPGARGLFILGHHGGGREVWKIPTGPDWQQMRDALLAMDERALYAFLYSVWQLASNASREAHGAEASRWAQAFYDGQLKKKRAKGGRRPSVEIVTPTSWTGPFYVNPAPAPAAEKAIQS